jgi:hypothetical protein
MPYDDLPNDGWERTSNNPFSWNEEDEEMRREHADPLAGGRGLVYGLLLGLALWAVVGAVWFVVDQVRAEAAPLPVPTATVPLTAYVERPAPSSPARPGPTVTVTVTRTAQPASRGRTAPLRASDEAFLRCVVQRESRGDPRAENPTSTASGLFQFLDGTWQAYSAEAGIGEQYRRASAAPASVQWALARWVVKEKGKYPWHYPPRPCP